MNELSNQVAVVTGGTGGIGLATARLFLAEGAKVILSDLDARVVDEAVRSLDSPNVRGLAGDVSKPATAKALVALATSTFGGLDVFVANAGTEGVVKPMLQYSEEDFDRVMAINVKGVLFAIQAAAPAMIVRGGGSIVVTASVAGLVGSPGLAAYIASKHAALGLVKTAALELGPSKVRVNAIAPGPIDNRMMDSIQEQASPGHGAEVKAGFASQIALGRYGTNDEIAQLALFLASRRSTYSTGAVFVADGGLVAR